MITILSGVVGSVLGGLGSLYFAVSLFTFNAPNANENVRNGYGFNLYTALAAGGVMGALAAVGLASKSSGYCIYCGAITAIILLALMPRNSKQDFWEGPDPLALPLLLAMSLLAWGVKLKSH